jgi:predicted RNA-binding protein with PIN domain
LEKSIMGAVWILYRESRIMYPICMPYWFDGNNLIGQSAAAARSDSQTRHAFLSALTSYHRSGGGRFLVYFDGDDPKQTAPPPGVAVRYSAPLSSDEAILQRLREIQNASEVIIVTNDRELAMRCRNEGAAVMDWPEFARKMQFRRRLQSKRSDKHEPVDVEDWLRYFGLDE